MQNSVDIEHIIFDKVEDFLPFLNSWRASNFKIVFTNGCFDILHVGHVDYLNKAKALGHKLVVGLNTDASVKRLKGPQRPLVAQHSRAIVIASLKFVDAVVLFDEETPLQLITTIVPNVLTKGADYTIENIVGSKFVADKGGEVISIPLVEGFSSSAIIKKMGDNNS